MTQTKKRHRIWGEVGERILAGSRLWFAPQVGDAARIQLQATFDIGMAESLRAGTEVAHVMAMLNIAKLQGDLDKLKEALSLLADLVEKLDEVLLAEGKELGNARR